MDNTKTKFCNFPLLGGDEAKYKIEEDAFNLKEMVNAFSESIAHRDQSKSFVVGIAGSWGSGKSSFINFVIENIINKSSDTHILEFKPWLIGDSPALFTYFFERLAQIMDGLNDKSLGFWRTNKWQLWYKTLKLSHHIRWYGKFVNSLSANPAATLAIDPSGTTFICASFMSAVFNIFNKLITPPTLEKSKSKIIDGLRDLKKMRNNFHILVVIDDLDRLEAHEVIEILRLVKKVANFPFITYVLCFDQKIIAEQVKNVLRVGNGYDYIEKIFQHIISIPPQEPFALRRQLKHLLNTSFSEEMNQYQSYGKDTKTDSDIETRKQYLFDKWAGKLIETPRDVILLHEAVKFGWPHIADRADFFDFVWLQMIKLKAPNLYEWVKNYATNIGAYRDNGRVDDDERKKESVRLDQIMDELGWDKEAYKMGINYFLPGIPPFVLANENRKVFEFDSSEIRECERDNRLGSPSHWRHYFAYTKPTYAVEDDEIATFRRVAKNDKRKAVTFINQLLGKPHEVKGHFVDILLDRLIDIPLTTEELQGIASVFAETMDEIACVADVRPFGENTIWRKSLSILRKRTETDGTYNEIFNSGKSINWLALVIRDQGFAHGIKNTDRTRPEKQWLTKEELMLAIQILTKRFSKLPPKEIFSAPSPLDILFCWLQLGDPKEVHSYIENATREDTLFLDALNAMRNWRDSSNKGVYYPLIERYVANFMDAKESKVRLISLASANNPNDELATKAKKLLADWEDENIPQE